MPTVISLLLLAFHHNPVLGSESKYYRSSAERAPKQDSSVIRKRSKRTTLSRTTDTSEAELIWNGVSSSFDVPLGDLVEHDGPWYQGFSGSFALNYPLRESVIAANPDNNVGGVEGINKNLSATIKYNPIGNWFATVTLSHYLSGDLQQPWEPDYTYVFGYSDWRPYTLSLLYSNYGGNRFSPEDGEKSTHFNRGTWSLGWKFPVAQSWINWASAFDDASMGCDLNYNYTPEFFDLASSEYLAGHQSVQLGCKYTITGNWYVNWAMFYYPDDAQKQPWNPDFTYGFGYFDWRPGTFTLQYNNYSGNRFPWNPDSPGTGRFKDGALMLAWSWAF
ncbi:hypothetical protein [uncultured Ferrimonas sp.]|uniref:hypothetical protein n=1 Tax=uncultured Ferrimonas sp. TaxID=432640 RepID=UPI002614307F|nr:hypothetical protein [uncultured Ferrimonas sp.]